MPDDPYTCTACGGATWHLRLSPDEADVSRAPRTVVAVWCTQCGTTAPPTHPFWPFAAEARAWTPAQES